MLKLEQFNILTFTFAELPSFYGVRLIIGKKMDDDYGQMFGGEDFMGDIGFEDEAILDYDDGDDNLDLGSDDEEEIESYVG